MFLTCIGVGYCSHFTHCRYKMHLNELKNACSSTASEAYASKSRRNQNQGGGKKSSKNDVASEVREHMLHGSPVM